MGGAEALDIAGTLSSPRASDESGHFLMRGHAAA